MIDLYYKSVGRGANLLLNVPPNREGLLSAEDVASLKAFGDYRRATFGKSVAAAAKGRPTEIGLKHEVAFNVIRVSEDIRYGQRVDGVAIDRWNAGGWEQIAAATSIGPRRLIHLDRAVTAARLRLRVTASSADPIFSEFALFAEPGN